jgi:serine/threonine-protein kinase
VRVASAGEQPNAGPAATLESGETVGAYRIERRIGAGRMGVVYEATSPDGARVALKLIKATLADDVVFRRRFAHEAKATARVSHPKVVRVLDAGEHRGLPFIVQELVRGRSLHERLRDEGALELEAAVRLCQEVAHGLDALHEAGVIHRDLTPANILLDEAGDPHITDFGLAKRMGGSVLTLPGQAIGSMHYMSPEQIRGGDVAATSDVYSLGCVVWECLCGTPPFGDREGMRVLWAHLQEEPPDPCARRHSLPPSLGWAITRALEKDPARRPPTATAYGNLVGVAARDAR